MIVDVNLPELIEIIAEQTIRIHQLEKDVEHGIQERQLMQDEVDRLEGVVTDFKKREEERQSSRKPRKKKSETSQQT